jgi:2-oxoglutarate ferredoxin oxidoreductase subunit gamma
MAKTMNVLLAGFGGQGILFSGKLLVYSGLLDGKEVSWLPSYGPEMRGGTCNCSVVISDESIGSPLVTAPDVLIAMNLPSLDKFEKTVVPGGTILLDSSLIERKVNRDDVKVCYVDASKLAEENNMKSSANIIIVGKMFRELQFCTEESLFKAVEKCVPPKKAALIEVNKNALKLGFTI